MYKDREFVIVDIIYREEAAYFKDIFPDRIGSTVKMSHPPRLGHSLILPFVSDKNGTTKSGLIATGIVLYAEEHENKLIFSTIEGTYTLQRANLL